MKLPLYMGSGEGSDHLPGPRIKRDLHYNSTKMAMLYGLKKPNSTALIIINYTCGQVTRYEPPSLVAKRELTEGYRFLFLPIVYTTNTTKIYTMRNKRN
jgi:hypothetical protein